MERDHNNKLSGLIELDDAYLGGERTGCKPGRGAETVQETSLGCAGGKPNPLAPLIRGTFHSIPPLIRGARGVKNDERWVSCTVSAAGKMSFVAAVETTGEYCPVRVKLRCGELTEPSVVKGFRTEAIKSWSQQHLTEGSTVISDGLVCFNAVVEAGCLHDKIVCGGGRGSVEKPEFLSSIIRWVNTILGNSKSSS